MGETPQPTAVPGRWLLDKTSYCFFAGVGVAAFLRLVLFYIFSQYEKMWKEHDESFASALAPPRAASLVVPADPGDRTTSESLQALKHALPREAAESMVSSMKGMTPVVRRIHEAIVKPLRWYPTLFFLFVLPQILLTITDNTLASPRDQELAAVIFSIFVPFRGFCLSLVFVANNRAFCSPRALAERLRARFSAYRLRVGSSIGQGGKMNLQERLLSVRKCL